MKYRVNNAGDPVADTRRRDERGQLPPRKSSPARAKYKAERFARRHASAVAAQAMHAAATRKDTDQ